MDYFISTTLGIKDKNIEFDIKDIKFDIKDIKIEEKEYNVVSISQIAKTLVLHYA